jgi:hypothetical protein
VWIGYCFLAGLLWCAVVLVAAARSALPAAAHMKMTNTGATGESRPLLPGFAMETPSALAVRIPSGVLHLTIPPFPILSLSITCEIKLLISY